MHQQKLRKKGRDALLTVLCREKNVTILESTVYSTVLRTAAEHNHDVEHLYKMYILQVVSDIQNKVSLGEIRERVKKTYGWRHPAFNTLRERMDEQDDFIVNPFHVEEGVIDCKCGSKRVFSYSKQTRGSDEPMTTFCECVECYTRWTYSG